MFAKQVGTFVVHTIPEQRKVVFTSFAPAFKLFKLESRKRFGSVALWRGPSWVRLYATPYYPEMLSQPYLYESHKETA